MKTADKQTKLFYKYADNGTADDKFLMSVVAFRTALTEHNKEIKELIDEIEIETPIEERGNLEYQAGQNIGISRFKTELKKEL